MNNQPFRHGEVLFVPTELPKEAQVLEKSNKYIVAHSETGHHHMLETKEKTDMSKFTIYSWNGERYIELPEIAELWHQKTGTEVHKPHTIPAGVYKINIKKSFNYAAKKMEQVRD